MKNKVLQILTVITFITINTVIYAQSNALKVKITAPNNYYDETIIRFLPNATQSFDSNFDAWKLFSPNPSVPSIYTETPEEYALSINTLPYLKQDVSTDLFTWVNSDGDYTFLFEEVFPFDQGVSLIMFDKSTNMIYDLRQNNSAIIHLTANQDSSARFELYFSYPVITEIFDESCFNTQDGALLISDKGNKDWNYQLKDPDGNIISSGNQIADSVYITNLSAGDYTLICSSFYTSTDTLQLQISSPDEVIADASADNSTVYLSQGDFVQFFNNSSGANEYLWDFGDGNTSTDIQPMHTYNQEGTYPVTLQAYNGNCNDITTLLIDVIDDVTFTGEIVANNDIKMWVSDRKLMINHGMNDLKDMNISIYNLSGQLISQNLLKGQNKSIAQISIDNFEEGIYQVILSSTNRNYSQKLFIGN